MKTNLKTLFTAGLLLCSSLSLSAATEKRGAMYLTTPANYQVLAISENGEWACGVVSSEDGDVINDFRWNLLTGKIELMGNTGTASGVANDGTVATSYYSTSVSSNGSKVEVPGLWKDGTWTMLELPANMSEGWAAAITPDGHHVTGTVYTKTGAYVSYIWKDGKISNNLESTSTSMAYCISPDGQRAGGWMYGGKNGNRCCGYWEASDNSWHNLEPGFPGAAWQAAKKFSPDNKKVLYWGGYHKDAANPDKGYGIKAIYNFETNDTTYIYPTEQNPFNFDLFDMGGNGSVVGYQQDDAGTEQAIIYTNGETQYLEDYLVALGCDFEGYDMLSAGDRHMIIRGVSISGDEKTFGILYYDSNYSYHTMIVALDRDLSVTPPVSLEAQQIKGLSVVSLSWSEPLGDKTDLKGYNIYRNGEKLNTDVVTSCTYYDKEVADGDYTYGVTAVYGEEESELSATAQVTVASMSIQGPRDVVARRKGYNDGYISWAAPGSNLVPCSYLDGAGDVQGFGGGSYSFESGTLFPAERAGLYAGYRLTAVSFYPGSEQGSWLINVYTHNDGELTSLGSFKVNQELQYGVENIITLPRQITLQKDHDLLIGIQTNVTNSSYNVQGVFEGLLKVGQTDLIRMIGEDDFYSLNTASNGSSYDMAWGTAAYLAPTGMTSDIDKIDHYNVFVDDALNGETIERNYVLSSIEEGTHNVGVQTVYADGRNSDIVNDELDLRYNDDALKVITPDVSVDGKHVVAAWEVPADDDATTLGYSDETCGSKCPALSSGMSELVARTDFYTTGSGKLNGYEGYQINAVSFFPMTDAIYEAWMYVNGEIVTMQGFENVVPYKWNTFSLDEPITIQRGKNYAFGLDMYDIPEGESPLGMDNIGAYSDYTNLYQLPNDDGWSNVDTEVGIDGNWMMRIGVAAPEFSSFDISGYDVYLDGKKVSDQQSETSYACDFSENDNSEHNLRVDARYTVAGKSVNGNTVNFSLAPEGIETATIERPAVLSIYNTNGCRLSAPRKGVNIFKMSNGKSRSQLVK